MRPILLGILAAFFFSITFILNRSMELSGGSWIWSASLRYFFMVPFLLIIVISRRNLYNLLKEMKGKLKSWIIWSTIGFGLFYAPICLAAVYSPGWLIASSWQITIISGSLLAPFFFISIQTSIQKVRGKIPFKGLGMSLLIIFGILLMQIELATKIAISTVLTGILPVIIASFAYPLGNRKMMELCDGKLDVYQRVLGMTLASLPFWFILSIYGLYTEGLPSQNQVSQSLIVAISSGVIATVLFFQATDLVRGNMQKLGAVEATQSMEVLFTVIGEMIFLSSASPSIISWIGMIIIMIGMILHSYLSQRGKFVQQDKETVNL
ncbi:DMT family transporter [Gottfriedia acidiceleris]|uniref:Multidrug resistance efflux transporter family protein n=1 Tax=Gottfriedia acidiceleris TaxID=371036 RepID=A0ABY4JL08_9BACI|nr:multidrug resistance efflux transporter family protein [Gottfriedia acidiceleris]UPM53583.1 multidrug resistance efflux transporter family protein [Gottfriedia acidiceleris]